MRATIKKLRDISGITKEELFVDRHILRFSNSQEAIWRGRKHFAL